jgi:hypothetical protein
VLLNELGLIDDILYVHPKDLQDHKIAVTENDILANVPYVSGCGLWFDHHSSECERLKLQGRFEGNSAEAPSAAAVVFEYYRQRPECRVRLTPFEPLVEMAGWWTRPVQPRGCIRSPGARHAGLHRGPRTGLGRKQDFASATSIS